MLIGVAPANWDGTWWGITFRTLESDKCGCKSQLTLTSGVIWGKLHNLSDPPSPHCKMTMKELHLIRLLGGLNKIMPERCLAQCLAHRKSQKMSTIVVLILERLGVSNCLCKGPSGKYFRLCGPHSICYNYLTLSLLCESSPT